jgi:DNA-binding Lrp family transcriptional regulator
MNIDKFDRAILSALQKDGRISNVDLAGLVSLSESACLRRVRRLEEKGFIEKYTALLDQREAGLLPEVMECYLMTGEFDYLLRVVVSDMADFERVHKESITRLPGVARVNSSVAIRTVRKTTELPLA